ANGAMLYEALEASKALAADGIDAEVINLHTVKPLDVETIVGSARKTGCVVTAEEHQIAGGMGSAVAECLALTNPVPIEFVGVRDTFGESGQPQELMDAYGLNAATIIERVKAVIDRKK
ncbi:MAG: transketolase family protein, partial [Selenomonadaceae bacterium]|nr:transketolase family protein [Selenomonadaceae bacterium]